MLTLLFLFLFLFIFFRYLIQLSSALHHFKVYGSFLFPNLFLISSVELVSLVDLFHVIKVRSTFFQSFKLHLWALSKMINLDQFLSISIFCIFLIFSSYSIKPIVISINNPFRGFVAFMLLCGKWCLLFFLPTLHSRDTHTHNSKHIHSSFNSNWHQLI